MDRYDRLVNMPYEGKAGKQSRSKSIFPIEQAEAIGVSEEEVEEAQWLIWFDWSPSAESSLVHLLFFFPSMISHTLTASDGCG